MANFYGATSLIGGGSGALDAIDGAGLADGDGALTITDGVSYPYHLNATSGEDESSPDIIAPDANPGDKRWELVYNFGTIIAEATRTINLLQSDNTAAKQAKIDAVGKYIPCDVDMIFQFETGGTHTETANLEFLGFFGGGRVYIQGNTAEADATALHTTQDTIIDVTAQTNIAALYISCCACRIFVQNFKIMLPDSDFSEGVQVNNIACIPRVSYNYVYAAGVVNHTRGIGFHECGSGNARENYVSSLKYGIYCKNSRIFSQENDDTGTQPLYGLYALYASVIGKTGTQPDGSTANELAESGSIIR